MFHMFKKLSRDMENIKKAQIELLEVKSISEMKNTSEMINSRLDTVEENMSELEGIVIDTIPNTTCRTKRIQTKLKEHQ